MTWANRLRLVGGMLVVLLVTAGFTVLFNKRQSQATSTSAAVASEVYAVGSDYGGLVIEQFVAEGDSVAAGDPLFAIQSLALQNDIEAGIVQADGTAFTVDGSTMTFFATVDGRVTSFLAKEGAFVPAGGIAAEIELADSLFALADFVLAPRDYQRIEYGAVVELLLPDGKTVEGIVDEINVQTRDDGQANTEIRVVTDELKAGEHNGLAKAGTPLEATLRLRDDGLISGAIDGFQAFARQIGL